MGGLLRGDPGRALAAFAGVLSATGAYRDVLTLAARGGEIANRQARFQTLLWEAHANASLDQFTAARRAARRARREAALSLSLSGLGRCSVAITYSRTAKAWLSVVKPPPLPLGKRLRRMTPFAAVLWTTIAFAVPSELAILRLRNPTRLPNPSTYRFAADYEEHLIRLMALLNRLKGRLPWLAPVIAWCWRRLGRRCTAIGYTWGVFNVSKYLTRDRADIAGPSGSVTGAAVMGDLLGRTIALRDAGQYYLTLPGREDDARRLLDEALGAARQLGCPSLELKIMLARLRGGIDAPYSQAEVTRVIAGADADGLRLERDAIVRALTGGPS